MSGIPREVIEDTLKIKPGSKLVKQRLRRFDEEKRRAIGEEITKLLAAEFNKEVYHPEWLANPVLVRKKSGKWRMCQLHGSQQSVSKGSVSFATHRPSSRLNLRVRNLLLP